MTTESTTPTNRQAPHKEKHRSLYNAISRRLASVSGGVGMVHLNYGYVPVETPGRAVHEEPEGEVSVRLILEVIGACDLNGKDVLDVGCGRGGTIRTIRKYFPEVRSLLGIDLSPEAIRFCRAEHTAPNIRFEVGDAEQLPVPDEAMDAIINIESACLYPNIGAFYRGVYRVLRPGGRFLYADSIDEELVAGRLEALREIGFSVLDEQDITRNVVRASDAVAESRFRVVREAVAAAAGRWVDPDELDRYLGNLICVPGSRKYQKYADGVERYVIFELSKGGEHGY